MKPANPRILTINGGSSSIKFALFEAGDSLRRILEGVIERIGLPEATLRVKGLNRADNFSRLVTAPDHTVAVGALMDWIEQRIGRDALTAVGHRVVHGGPKYHEPALITKEMVQELRHARHIMVKSRVETRYLGQIGKSAMKRLGQQNLLRHMVRIEWTEATQLLNHFRSDSLRLVILRAAIHHAMPNRDQCVTPAAFLDPIH